MSRLISSDSHVTLPQAKIKAHLESRYHAAYDDAVAGFESRVLAQGTGKSNREGLLEYNHPAFGRPGSYDPIERLKDMDTDGIDCEVLYCEVSAFRYLYLMEEGMKSATRAFNDSLAEFEAADPSRLVVSYQVPVHDIDFAIQEVERLAAKGARSLQLPLFPNELGLPDYPDDRYERLWELLDDVGVPLCFHVGINTSLDELASRDPTEHGGVWKPMVALSTAQAFGFWIMTGLLERHKSLRLVFVESGVGWVPWYLDMLDDFVTRQQRTFPDIVDLPSEYFHRNIHLTFIDEPDTVQLLRSRVGVENLMWSTDYPHPVSSWPDSRSIIEKNFVGVPEIERDLMVQGNAARLWKI